MFQEPCGGIVRSQQAFDLAAQIDVTAGDDRHPCLALFGRPVQCLLEQLLHA
jgi:hypothetical protein